MQFEASPIILSPPPDSPDTSHASYDGPHIFYRQEHTIIKQILVRGDKVYPVMDTLFGKIPGKQITCHVNDSIKFRTTIKKSIKDEPSIYPAPSKLFAISDIEGNFITFRDLLVNNGVMSPAYKWTFGTGHLVLNGDFFDRGLHVTECLWLVYHLEQEALKAGGYVHFILGNHEIMNMNGDLRYMRNKYYENTYIIQEAYSNWYTPDTELGRWLQSKNIVEKIGTYLFTHGGISPEVAADKADVEKINSLARDFYYKEAKALECKDEFLVALFSDKTSPFWYRGYVSQTIDEAALNTILTKYEVTKIVVGHSIVDDVRYFYNGKVIAIDTKHASGDAEALLIESGTEYRVDLAGKRFPIH
ncbi:MAG: metallophosphoesterase [Saprospiraceae bacterium]|nr:metallophosphoesterase [Candidatus Opimibacter skivensis]